MEVVGWKRGGELRPISPEQMPGFSGGHPLQTRVSLSLHESDKANGEQKTNEVKVWNG